MDRPACFAIMLALLSAYMASSLAEAERAAGKAAGGSDAPRAGGVRQGKRHNANVSKTSL